MKRNLSFILAAIAAFAVALSCTKVEEPATDAPVLTDQMTISATLSDVMTKVSFTPSFDASGKAESIALVWAEGDMLRVYNHADRTQYSDFVLDVATAGTKTGNFTGTPVTASSYDIEVINSEVDYAVQTQPADGVATSLKYLASASAVTDLKAVEFTEYSSVLAITAKMPEGAAAGIASVELSASEAIFNTGKTLKIQLNQVGDAGEDGVLNLFATLPKGDQQIAEGTTLLVTFNAPDTDHTVYTRFVELDAQTFTAGKLNTININATQSDKHAGLVSCDGSSAEKAYLIGDKYQLNAMSSLVSADAVTHFAMVADVDLGETSWTSVSGKVAFEGNNHKISNVTAASGLFSTLDGSVQNLDIDAAAITATAAAGVLADNAADNVLVKNINVTNSAISNTADVTGGLIGKLVGGSVEDVKVDCAVTSTKAKVGGLVGEMTAGTLTRCDVLGTVSSSYYYVGGLVGYATTVTVSECSASGKVTSERDNYSRTGGLIGQIYGGSITKSYAAGDVECLGAYGGGLLGAVEGDITVSKSYAAGAVTNPGQADNNMGGLIGYINNCTVTVSDSYSSGAVTGKNYNGGFIGVLSKSATMSVSNSYTNSAVNGGKWNSGVFAGAIDGTLTCEGFIGWNVSSRVVFYYNYPEATCPDGNYMGTEGTISAKAKEFGWDETIWDLSGDEPKLK